MKKIALLCLLAAPAWAQSTAEGKYYRVVSEGDQATADTMLRVLEAAWPAFQKHFGAKPKIKRGEKLVVRHFLTNEACSKAVQETGAPPLNAGGIYLPSTKIAYFTTQPTIYYTRVLLLHEAAHQFHYLARTKNKEPTAIWYTEGLAEFLSWHHWDGSKLQLGVRPMLSLNDRPGAALKAVKGVDFPAMVEGKTELDRPLAWALVRWLATGGKGGKPHKKWKAFTKKMDAGNQPGSLFRKFFGKPAAIKADFEKWIATQQTPWVHAFNDWEPLSDNSLRGVSKVHTVAHLREPANNLTATLVKPAKPGWNIGVTLAWKSKDDYTIALLNYAGFMEIKRWHDGHWKTMERGPVPGLEGFDKYKFQIFRRGAEVSMLVNDVGFGPWELSGDRFGLALRRGEATFVDITWK